jgi:hypothetical protein
VRPGQVAGHGEAREDERARDVLQGSRAQLLSASLSAARKSVRLEMRM